MAKGDTLTFQAFHVAVSSGLVDLTTAPVKCALISNALGAYDVTDLDPRFGAGGGTNLALLEVSGGGYTAGGAVCANPSVPAAAGVIRFDVDDPAIWSQNGTGPTNIMTAVFYVDDASKRVISLMDLTNDAGTTPISLQDGDIEVQVNALGLYRQTIL